FFANTDDTHCFQAVLRMILKHFLPAREFAWEELDKVTGKITNGWTWPYLGLMWMRDQGFDVINVDTFDNSRFSREGLKYLIEEYGEEFATSQAEHCDIAYEQKNAELFIETCKVERRSPDQRDLKSFLDRGYLVACNVNSVALNGQSGYAGHF